MGILKLAHYYTPAEYFEIDENSDFRYEYANACGSLRLIKPHNCLK